MEYLTLNNGTRMPLVGFGTFMLGGEACTNAVAAAIRSGYRLIDTAAGAFRAENCAVKAENQHSSISAPYPSYPVPKKPERRCKSSAASAISDFSNIDIISR
mgnify:CR=1 FL=1